MTIDELDWYTNRLPLTIENLKENTRYNLRV